MRNALSCFTIVGKHDGLFRRSLLRLSEQAEQQFVEGFELVGNGRFHLVHLQPFGLLLVAAEVELLIVVEACPGRDGDGVGGRSEDALADAGQGVDDGVHLFLEAQFERFVKFVDHKVREGRGLDVAAFDVVLQSSGCAHHEDILAGCLWVEEPFQLLLFHACVVPAVAGHASDVGVQALPHVGNLLHEFAARGDDERPSALLPEGQEVGKRLAAARRSQQQDVAPLGEDAQHVVLHRVERSKTKGLEGEFAYVSFFCHCTLFSI